MLRLLRCELVEDNTARPSGKHCQIKTAFDQIVAFPYSFGMQNHSPFRYFNSSPDIIRLAVMMYVRYPLSLRQVEDLLFERGIDICHETVRCW